MTEQRRLFVIGGRPRTGKSTIANRVKARRGPLEILHTDQLRPHGDDELAWQNTVNCLKTVSFAMEVLIEGVAITPSKVHSLKLDTLALESAVFLGYGRASHADTILEPARKAKDKDWVYGQLQANPEYESEVRSWMVAGIQQSAQLKRDAEYFGYGYFDITDYPTFEEYAATVTSYLLKCHTDGASR